MLPINHDLEQLPKSGFAEIGSILDKGKSLELRDWIDDKRPLTNGIFYETEEEFNKHGRWNNYAPGRNDHNLLLSPELDLSFIEENAQFYDAMVKLCGTDWQIFKKSIIRSVPRRVMPEWVKTKTQSVGRPNVNPFIIESHKDIQHFVTTDFHQDKTRAESDFVTVYIYIDEVSAKDSPLLILLNSQELGMSCYPHNLRRDVLDKNLWYYSNSMLTGSYYAHTVTGAAGSIACFHCLTLHGTGFNDTEKPRISLRYLIKKGDGKVASDSLLSQANKLIRGPLFIDPNRADIAEDGSFLNTGSSLLSYSDLG
jgi:hypothetical protein